MTLALLACLALLLLLEPASCEVMELQMIGGCEEHNTDDTCRTCQIGLVLLQGICVRRDLCADGRQLVFGQCLIITNCADRTPDGFCRISQPPSDPYCGTWDWDNQVCLACATGK